jgi:hypothetical protein
MKKVSFSFKNLSLFLFFLVIFFLLFNMFSSSKEGFFYLSCPNGQSYQFGDIKINGKNYDICNCSSSMCTYSNARKNNGKKK